MITTLSPAKAEVPFTSLCQSPNLVGKFTVIHTSGITKFEILDQALKYYESLEEHAAVWDVTNDEILLMFKSALHQKFISNSWRLSI